MAFLCALVVYNRTAQHVQWSKIEKLNPWRNGCHTNVAVTEQRAREGKEVKSDSNITTYMCTYLCMYFMYFVYSNAAGCMCKTFQMAFFSRAARKPHLGKEFRFLPSIFLHCLLLPPTRFPLPSAELRKLASLLVQSFNQQAT